MDVFQLPEGRMALGTEARHLLGQFECFFAFLRMRSDRGLVTGITGLCDGMDVFRLEYLRVTLPRYAAFLSCGCSAQAGKEPRQHYQNDQQSTCFFDRRKHDFSLLYYSKKQTIMER
jgi:hypothetical protein